MGLINKTEELHHENRVGFKPQKLKSVRVDSVELEQICKCKICLNRIYLYINQRKLTVIQFSFLMSFFTYKLLN